MPYRLVNNDVLEKPDVSILMFYPNTEYGGINLFCNGVAYTPNCTTSHPGRCFYTNPTVKASVLIQ
jgi:hypothetical protein